MNLVIFLGIMLLYISLITLHVLFDKWFDKKLKESGRENEFQ